MTDEQAYMELVLCNTQSELHPLEEGKHAAESGMDLKAYAEASGKVRKTLSDKVMAWRVWSVADIRHDGLRDSWSQLSVIHAAPNWLWSALVKQMVESGWTVQVTRDKVGAFKEVADPPSWADSGRIAEALWFRLWLVSQQINLILKLPDFLAPFVGFLAKFAGALFGNFTGLAF